MKTAIAFTTKDRIDFTEKTLPRILDDVDGKADVFWLDGSVTPEGKQFPANFAFNWRRDHDGRYPVKEFHKDVGGGAAAVIQTAWRYLLGKEYEYIGLIENDVLLEPGWFDKCMGLFDKPKYVRDDEPASVQVGEPWPVGAVSARCFTDRILERYDNEALMANVGAGMFITKKELIAPLLESWQTPMLWQMEAYFQHFTRRPYPIPPMIKKQDPELKLNWLMTHDWLWEAVLLHKGFITLACTPSMAINLDDPHGERDPVEK